MFGVLVWVASLPLMHRLDVAATAWLQRAAPAADLPAAIFVLLGNAEVVIPCVALTAGLLFPWKRRSAAAALRLAAVLTAASLLAVGLKYVIVHPGPPAAFQRSTFALGIHASTPYSFPSGHTLRTALLVGPTLGAFRWLAGPLVLGMMVALVYLGDHWLSDVLGGLCLGWVLMEAGAAIRKARSRSYRRG